MADWASIVGGGAVGAVVAAGITLVGNFLLDSRSKERAEQWELRRYKANQISFAAAGLRECYFSALTEMRYTLNGLIVINNAASTEIATINASPGSFEDKEPFVNAVLSRRQEQTNLRWSQYEQKIRDINARALVHFSILSPPLIPALLHQHTKAVVDELAEDFVWDRPRLEERLTLFLEAEPQLLTIMEEVENLIEERMLERHSKGFWKALLGRLKDETS